MLISVLRTKVPGDESSRERRFQGTKVPENESSKERKFQGTKVPPMELSFPGTKVLGYESSMNLLRLGRPDGLLPINTSVTKSNSSWWQFQSELILFPVLVQTTFETVHC